MKIAGILFLLIDSRYFISPHLMVHKCHMTGNLLPDSIKPRCNTGRTREKGSLVTRQEKRAQAVSGEVQVGH